MNDIEERLMAAYRAVAARTEVAEGIAHPAEVPLAPARTHARARPRLILAVASTLVLVAVAVVVLRAPRPPEPGTTHTARMIAVPMFTPDGSGYSEGGAPGGPGGVLGFEGSFADTHVVRYQVQHGHIIVVSAPSHALPTPGIRAITLASGVTAQLTVDTDFTVLAWAQPDGVVVNVRASPGLADEVMTSIANGMWYVTPSMFDRIAARGGFAQVALDRWQIPGDGSWHADSAVTGSLQDHRGLLIAGFLGVQTATRCGLSEGEQSQYVLTGPGTTVEFLVTSADGVAHRVPAGRPPGIPTMAVGLSGFGGTVKCVEAGQ